MLGCARVPVVYPRIFLVATSCTSPCKVQPSQSYAMLIRSEFVMSATTAAIGMLVWRRANRKLSVIDYVIALGGASILVLAVFKFYIGH